MTDSSSQNLDQLSTSELEQELDKTRESISRNVAALQEDLEPRHLIDTGIETLRERINFDEVMDFVGANPVPVVLTVTGLAWLGLSYPGRSKEQVGAQIEAEMDRDFATGPEPYLEFRPERPRLAMSGRSNQPKLSGTPMGVVLAGLGVGLLAGLYLADREDDNDFEQFPREYEALR